MKSSRTGLKTYLSALLLLAIGFLVAYQFVDPAPPKTIVISTGGQDGAYYLFAQRYRELLAKLDIRLEVRNSAGSSANLALLSDPSSGIDLAFVQGGTGSGVAADSELTSLGSLYFEPLWVFYRSEQDIKRLPDLQGKRIAVGMQESGTRMVALALLRDNNISEDTATIMSVGGHELVESLREGTVDATFLVASPESPTVQELLHAEGISILSFERAYSYTLVHRFLSRITLPEGVIDFQKNIPPKNITLLAPAASLVIRKDFHPALISLLLRVAQQVHESGGLFETHGAFPSPMFVDFPLNPEADRFYKSGPPFLQRFLPFWLANLIDRMLVMLFPVAALLVPFFKVMPPLYRWQVRKKIYRWYDDLQKIDIHEPENASTEEIENLLHQLTVLEAEIETINIPLPYVEELYNLRLHLELVRNKLAKQN